MSVVTPVDPIKPSKSTTSRWRAVWRDGNNLFALVENEAGGPLPRNREIPSDVSKRYQQSLSLMLAMVDLRRPHLWRDLELVDEEICTYAPNVGPTTILHLVSELAEIARTVEPSLENNPVSLSSDVLTVIAELSLDRLVYAVYGGSPSGFKRLARDSWRDGEDGGSGDVRDQLLVSDLGEAKKVLRNIADCLERSGHLFSSDYALRWLWDGGGLDLIIERYGVGPTVYDLSTLRELEDAVPILRDRLIDGKSMGEIARMRGRRKYDVHRQIVKWADLVPVDLYRAFQGPQDSRVFELNPGPDDILPTYQHPFNPGHCLNCDEPRVTIAAPLYCSEVCKQTAKVVRYARACSSDGRISRPDVQEAIEMRVAHILAGGYPEKARHIPDQLRESVLRDANGHCQKCGRPFDESDSDASATIQHMGGSSPERSNLQAWCRRCNMTDAQSRFTSLSDTSIQSSELEAIRMRWESPVPLRACDDDERWEAQWRRYARLVKATLALD